MKQWISVAFIITRRSLVWRIGDLGLWKGWFPGDEELQRKPIRLDLARTVVVACRPTNPKVGGSNPWPAEKYPIELGGSLIPSNSRFRNHEA